MASFSGHGQPFQFDSAGVKSRVGEIGRIRMQHTTKQHVHTHKKKIIHYTIVSLFEFPLLSFDKKKAGINRVACVHEQSTRTNLLTSSIWNTRFGSDFHAQQVSISIRNRTTAKGRHAKLRIIVAHFSLRKFVPVHKSCNNRLSSHRIEPGRELRYTLTAGLALRKRPQIKDGSRCHTS